MHGILQLITEPVFANAKEKKFCMVVIDRVEKSHASFWFYASFVYWILTIAVGYAFHFDSLTTMFLTASGIVAITVKATMLRIAKKTSSLRIAQLSGFIAANVVMCIAAKMQAVSGGTDSALLVLWGTGSVLAVGLLAYRNYVHIAALLIFLVPYAWSLQGQPMAVFWLICASSLAILTSNAQIIAKRFIKLELIRSYRQQSVYTPKQVLLQAVESQSNVSDIFKPEMRYCVCLCSDWRNFQAFANGVPPSQLAETLENYYDLQIKLLDQEFPEGNYFIDWIADELFVVAFLIPSCDESALIDRATRFAIESLAARPTFFETHGAPNGIDVGISACSTTLGMLGPVGNKKATALGQVPGLARRLQMFGKSLRAGHGSVDRIVIDPRIHLGDKALYSRFSAVPLPEGIEVKDFNFSAVSVFQSSDPASSVSSRKLTLIQSESIQNVDHFSVHSPHTINSVRAKSG